MASGETAPLEVNNADIEQFLQILHGNKPASLWAYTWHLPNKDSACFQSINDLITATQRRASAGKDTAIYTSASWGTKRYGASHRLKATDAAGLPALWIDLDIAGEGHKKPNLPPSLMAAMEFLDDHAPEPSLTVFSGHGIQAWWLFPEPWLFADEEQRADAMKLALDWNNYLRAVAKQVGWDIDAVHDLARVMRVPGTINAKEAAAPVLSSLRAVSDARYTPSVFTQLMETYYASEAQSTAAAAQRFITQRRNPVTVGGSTGITIRPDAGPPYRKWEALQEVEHKVKLTWDHKRRDMQDQSASAYDLSLASFAVRAGWEDQEICDLLVTHRQRYNESLKRVDYYERTIAVARQTIADNEAKDQIEDIVIDIERGAASVEEVRQRALDSLGVRFKVKIVRIIKFCEQPARYILETEKGRAEIGGFKELMSQSYFRGVVFDLLKHVMPDFSKSEWKKILVVIGMALEEWEGDAESTIEGRAWAWIDGYLARRQPLEDVDEAIAEMAPYEKDGYLYIFGGELRRHLSATRAETVTSKAMGQALRLIGCVAEQVSARVNGRQVCRQVWRIPNHDATEDDASD